MASSWSPLSLSITSSTRRASAAKRAAAARTADVPVYLEGVGTTRALKTVIVRTQVDGKLIEVRYKEGQDVKRGDVLARIDPTTYKALLDQAMAKKAQDEATLANARIDLDRPNLLFPRPHSIGGIGDAPAFVGLAAANIDQGAAVPGDAQASDGQTFVTGIVRHLPGREVRCVSHPEIA